MSIRNLQVLIITLGSLIALSATEICLPSLPTIACYFKACDGITQFAIPFYMLGAFFSTLFFGSFSDWYGRIPTMLIGAVIFLSGTLTCILSPSILIFLLGRIIQGFGAVTFHVIGWVVIQELYPKDAGTKAISWIGNINCLVPLFVPSFGGYVHHIFGWQANFFLLTLLTLIIIGLILFVKSKIKITSPKKKFLFLENLKIYQKIIKNKSFLFYISFFSLLSCGEWCYLTSIPFYLENSLQIPPYILGLCIAMTSLFYISASLLCPLILNYLGAVRIIFLGVNISLIGSFFFFFINFFPLKSPFLIAAAIGPYFFGMALIWGPSMSKALQCFKKTKGAASAVRSIILISSGMLGGFIGSFFHSPSIVPLSSFLLCMTGATWIIFKKKNYFLNYSGKEKE